MRNKRALGWFLFGLGSQLQIVASLSFTELFVLCVAPFVASREWPYMRKNGVTTFFWLAVMVFIGCVSSCILNHTPSVFAVRGLAVTTILPCAIIVSHWMLRKDPAGFKWMIVGGAISSILCTFIFQKSVEVAIALRSGGNASSDDIMAGAVYWKNRLAGLLNAPLKGWYLQCPLWLSVVVPLGITAFSMLATASGRGTALCALASAFMVIVGGKQNSSMRRIGKHFFIFLIGGLILALSYKAFYSYAAPRGMLGEEARLKYERQTRGDSSIAKLLLGGRMESFCGLLAAIDKPIVGFGPWALDTNGYTTEFLYKYGSPEDYEAYQKSLAAHAAMGHTGFGMINCHSHITMFWVWYGIFGLIFWLYVVFALVRFLKQDAWAVPQWYMWLACAIPNFCWDILFNPMDSRVGSMMFVVACLFARAVRRRRFNLPVSMIQEIVKAERR